MRPGGGGPWLVLVAAGSGQRLGAAAPKALVEVGGRSLLAHALEGVQRAGVRDVVIVGPAGQAAAVAAVADRFDLRIVHVDGGATRPASVRRGLARVPDAVAIVAIHDAARALTPPAVIRAAIDAVDGDVVAAAPALPLADTVKQVDGDAVVATVDRATLAAVQTPQAFRHAVLRTALEWDGAGARTDDLAVVEAARAAGVVSGMIRLVAGSVHGLKITHRDDLTVAEALLGVRAEATPAGAAGRWRS